MGKRGRPSKPDAVKAAKGTLRPSRVNKNSPVPPDIDGVPNPPDFLGPQGKSEWCRIVDQLDRMKMLAKTDLSMLAAACMEWEHYLNHRQMQSEYGSFYTKIDQFGNKMFLPHPNHYNGNAHLKNYMEICREFGFTPASRSKISVPQSTNQQKSPLAGILKKTG